MHYLYWEIIFIISPTIVLGIIFRHWVKKYFQVFILSTIGAIIFAFPWDYIMVKGNIWNYHPQELTGIWIFGLPIEEWIFIIVVTWFFILMTFLFKSFQKNDKLL